MKKIITYFGIVWLWQLSFQACMYFIACSVNRLEFNPFDWSIPETYVWWGIISASGFLVTFSVWAFETWGMAKELLKEMEKES